MESALKDDPLSPFNRSNFDISKRNSYQEENKPVYQSNNKSFLPGQLISHNQFGKGIILKKEEIQGKVFLTVKFEHYQENKKVLDSFITKV